MDWRTDPEAFRTPPLELDVHELESQIRIAALSKHRTPPFSRDLFHCVAIAGAKFPDDLQSMCNLMVSRFPGATPITWDSNTVQDLFSAIGVTVGVVSYIKQTFMESIYLPPPGQEDFDAMDLMLYVFRFEDALSAIPRGSQHQFRLKNGFLCVFEQQLSSIYQKCLVRACERMSRVYRNQYDLLFSDPEDTRLAEIAALVHAACSPVGDVLSTSVAQRIPPCIESLRARARQTRRIPNRDRVFLFVYYRRTGVPRHVVADMIRKSIAPEKHCEYIAVLRHIYSSPSTYRISCKSCKQCTRNNNPRACLASIDNTFTPYTPPNTPWDVAMYNPRTSRQSVSSSPDHE